MKIIKIKKISHNNNENYQINNFHAFRDSHVELYDFHNFRDSHIEF